MALTLRVPGKRLQISVQLNLEYVINAILYIIDNIFMHFFLRKFRMLFVFSHEIVQYLVINIISAGCQHTHTDITTLSSQYCFIHCLSFLTRPYLFKTLRVYATKAKILIAPQIATSIHFPVGSDVTN